MGIRALHQEGEAGDLIGKHIYKRGKLKETDPMSDGKNRNQKTTDELSPISREIQSSKEKGTGGYRDTC